MNRVYKLPLRQSIGAVPVPVVSTGQRVNRGTRLAEPEGLGVPLHASVSGVITEITAAEVRILADEVQEESFEPLTPNDDIVEMVRSSGLCGMGGAGFPTYIKLGTPLQDGLAILNAVECEPLLNHNIVQLTQNPRKACRGLMLTLQATKASRGVIAIKSKNREAVQALRGAIGQDEPLEILELPDRYPMGEERAVVREAMNILLQPDQLPAAAGAVVINAETASRISEAVDERRPVISKNLTLAGFSGLDQPRVLLDVPLGTPVGELISRADGPDPDWKELQGGGPFTGSPLNLEDAVVKTLGGILARATWPGKAGPVGLLVCACGPSGVRMRKFAGEMGAAVAGVQVCNRAVLVKNTLKCANPGVCPGQAAKLEALQQAGARVVLTGACYDCTREIAATAPAMGLEVLHATDPFLSAAGSPLIRGFPGH